VQHDDRDKKACGEAVNPHSVSQRGKRKMNFPAGILFEEFRFLKPCLNALDIGFSVSRAKMRARGGKQRKPPYFACRYNSGTLSQVNVVAYCYPLITDWELMGSDPSRYRQRIKSALRKEMIHAVQLLTVKSRYEKSLELRGSFLDPETYYNHLLGRIIAELAGDTVGEKAILTAAKLYYEDWTLDTLEKLKQADRNYKGRDGYLVCELIRQVTQIRFGELTSEEAKGTAWDRHRVFSVGEFGTTENLMMDMVATLRRLIPQLIDLSPTLTEALSEIETTILTIDRIDGAALLGAPGENRSILS
jgi:hypothetical protein